MYVFRVGPSICIPVIPSKQCFESTRCVLNSYKRMTHGVFVWLYFRTMQRARDAQPPYTSRVLYNGQEQISDIHPWTNNIVYMKCSLCPWPMARTQAEISLYHAHIIIYFSWVFLGSIQRELLKVWRGVIRIANKVLLYRRQIQILL